MIIVVNNKPELENDKICGWFLQT